MITWLIMFIQKIEGANFAAGIVLAVWAIYLGLFLIVKPNRGKSQFKTAGIAGLVVTFICDLVWFFKFFDNFEYINPGFAGMAWFFLFPAVMMLLVMFLSYVNASRFEYDEKKRKKEAEKLRKKESRRAKFEAESAETEENK